MSDVLAGLGLAADPGSEPGAAPVNEPAAPAAPAAPQSVTGIPAAPADAPEAVPAAVATPPEDDEIVVPEGAENPDAVRNAIAAERAAARAAYKRAREAEAELARITEAAMPVEERLTAAAKRADDSALEALRLRVGMKHGLSETFSDMLKGTDEASLETHAQSILAELGQRRTPTVPGVSLDGGVKPPPPTTKDPVQAHNNFLGQLLGRTPGA